MFYQASFASQNVFDCHSPWCVSAVAFAYWVLFCCMDVYCLSIHLLMDIWVLYRFLAFMNKAPIIFFMGHWFSFLLHEFPGVRLLSRALRVFIGSCQSLFTSSCSKCAETLCGHHPVVHIHNGVLLSHSKEHIRISSNEVDETGAYYTEWSKPERKTPIQYTNAYIWNLERW